MSNDVTKEISAFPQVEFQTRPKILPGVELIELDSLYGRASNFDHNIFAPHRVNFHHLMYITESTGTHLIDFNNHSYEAGSCIAINAGQVHAFDSKKTSQGYLIIFTQAFLDTVRTTIRVPNFLSGFYTSTDTQILTVQDPEKESFEALLKELLAVKGEKPHDELICQLLFTALVLKLDQMRPVSEENQVSEERRQHFVRFLSLVEEKFCSLKNVTLYADLMGMTYKSLNVTCKLVTNRTPKQIIDAHTILEAKRRLAIENIQVTQLAYELGFNDVSNFAKYFKRHTLMTPHQFRANLNK